MSRPVGGEGEAERVPARVEQNLPRIARLLRRERGAGGKALLHTGVEVVDGEVEVNCFVPFEFGQAGGW